MTIVQTSIPQTSEVSKTSEVFTADAFKETELGPIPADWDVVPLGIVASFNMGQSPPSSTYNTTGEGLPFLQGKAEFGDIYPTPLKWCSHPQKVANSNAVLISVRAPVGDVNIAREKYCIGRGLAAINGGESLNNWFLFYQLIFAKQRLEDEGTGSTFKSINRGVLENFLIPLPPLDEQRRIAQVLNTIQREIAAQNKLIAAAREVKRSLMQRLFTYGPGAEPAPTKETEIGEVPENWEVVPVGRVVELKYGYQTSIPKESPSNGVLIISTAEIKNAGYLDLSKIRTVEIPQPLVEKYTIRQNDILFNWRNAQEHVGKTALVEFMPKEPMIFASFIIRIRTLERLNYRFMHFLLTYLRDKRIFFKLSRRAVNQANFNANELAELKIAIPELAEQDEIAHILTTVDCKIAAEEQRKSALQALFKSMLHQLMTGQLRV